MSLWPLFLNHQGRIVHKWVHYFPIYERHFCRYVNRPITFVEIGCGDGGSLQLWKQYFGPYARIVGLDIRPKCKAFEEDQIHVRIGDQSDEQFLLSMWRSSGRRRSLLTTEATKWSTLPPHSAVYTREWLRTVCTWEKFRFSNLKCGFDSRRGHDSVDPSSRSRSKDRFTS